MTTNNSANALKSSATTRIVLTTLTNTKDAEDVLPYNVYSNGVLRKQDAGEWLRILTALLACQTERVNGTLIKSNGEAAS